MVKLDRAGLAILECYLVLFDLGGVGVFAAGTEPLPEHFEQMLKERSSLDPPQIGHFTRPRIGSMDIRSMLRSETLTFGIWLSFSASA